MTQPNPPGVVAVSWAGQSGLASLNGAEHVPVVIELRDGAGWGVYCHACSAAVRDYVPICLVFDRPDWPPTRLVEPCAAHDVDVAVVDTGTARRPVTQPNPPPDGAYTASVPVRFELGALTETWTRDILSYPVDEFTTAPPPTDPHT